jgi:hypothetical protein
MKIAVKYEVVVNDDDGNVIADATAQVNVTSVVQLIDMISNAITQAETLVAHNIERSEHDSLQ